MAQKGERGDTRDQEMRALRVAQERMRDRFVALGTLAQRMAASLNPATVLQEVVDAACELTGAHYGALGTFNADGRIVDFITHGVTSEERARIGDLPTGLGLLGWLRDRGGVPRWVAISALDAAEAAERYGQLDGKFIAKPFNPTDLLKRLGG